MNLSRLVSFMSTQMLSATEAFVEGYFGSMGIRSS